MWKLANNFHINIILFEKNTHNAPSIFTADTDSSIAKNIFTTNAIDASLQVLQLIHGKVPATPHAEGGKKEGVYHCAELHGDVSLNSCITKVGIFF